MTCPEIGRDIGQVAHRGHINPGIGHGNDDIGAAEAERLGETDRVRPLFGGFMDKVGAGHSDMDFAADQFAGNLTGRQEAHGDAGQGCDITLIGARATRTVDGQPCIGEDLSCILFEAALGGNGEDESAHCAASFSSRSTQRAQPDAAISRVAPSLCSSRS